MKKLLLLLLIPCLLLCSCNIAGSERTTTEETTEEKNTDAEWVLEAENQLIEECNPPRGEVVWDTYPLEVVFPIVVPELDNAKIECLNDQVYLNEEPLGVWGCWQFYLSDLTGDGYPELCFAVARGHGMVDHCVLVYDYATKSEVFELSDRMEHDYTLYLKDGVLLIRETNYPREDVNRVGTFAYDGSKITVTWGSARAD